VKVTPEGTRTVLLQFPDQDRLEICAVAATADPKRFILDICAPSLGMIRDGNAPTPAVEDPDEAFDRIYLLTTS
jgi:hypothetical protein